MLLDDQVDTNLDTPLDLVPKNEFFLRKYLQLIAEDIQLENLMDTAEDISMVDQPVIELETLLDIDEDTVSDTDMDGANTFESLQTTLPVFPDPLDADDIGKKSSSKNFPYQIDYLPFQPTIRCSKYLQ